MSIRTDLLDLKSSFRDLTEAIDTSSFGDRYPNVEAAIRLVLAEIEKGKRLVEAAAQLNEIDEAEIKKARAQERLVELGYE